MVSGVDVGRADGVGEHLVRRGEVVVKARGRVRDARAAAIGIIRREHVPYEREQASLRLEHGPLRPPEGEQLVPAAETVATVAAQRVMAARLRPSGGGDLLRHAGTAEKVHPRVQRQPELAARGHGVVADAGILGVLRGDGLKERKCRERRKLRRLAAVIRRQNDVFFKISRYFHIVLRLLWEE